jgi:hypothetical protein
MSTKFPDRTAWGRLLSNEPTPCTGTVVIRGNGWRTTCCLNKYHSGPCTWRGGATFVDVFNGVDALREKLAPCRRNLRKALGKNQRNARVRYDNTSGFKGVNWNKRTGMWKAQIRVGSIKKHLGCFSSAVKAAKAYDTASRKYFGEFALTNF